MLNNLFSSVNNSTAKGQGLWQRSKFPVTTVSWCVFQTSEGHVCTRELQCHVSDEILQIIESQLRRGWVTLNSEEMARTSLEKFSSLRKLTVRHNLSQSTADSIICMLTSHSLIVCKLNSLSLVKFEFVHAESRCYHLQQRQPTETSCFRQEKFNVLSSQLEQRENSMRIIVPTLMCFNKIQIHNSDGHERQTTRQCRHRMKAAAWREKRNCQTIFQAISSPIPLPTSHFTSFT